MFYVYISLASANNLAPKTTPVLAWFGWLVGWLNLFNDELSLKRYGYDINVCNNLRYLLYNTDVVTSIVKLRPVSKLIYYIIYNLHGRGWGGGGGGV